MNISARDMLGRAGLQPVGKARELLLSSVAVHRDDFETITLVQALDRVLAADRISGEDLPPRARSVMDGFAVRAADTFGASESMPCYLEISGKVEMGALPEGTVEKGFCHRIATGGFLPGGADAVVMLEHTIPVDETMVEIVKGVGSGTNLIQRGEDIANGQTALSAGRRLRPQDLGLLAALGVTKVQVFPRPRVGILSTGDEIISPEEQMPPGKIRDINSTTMAGLILRHGGLPTSYGIVKDTKETFFPALEKAVAENDIVLFSGGSSVGARDLGEQAVEALGPPGILVHGVALKPGKPVLIGLSGTTPLFGLPGHPVSAMICFELFIAPVMAKLSGETDRKELPEPALSATLSRNINSAAGRLDIVRVKLLQNAHGELIADPVLGRSGAISTLSGADGYFIIEEDNQGVSQGTPVQVYRYR